MSYWYWILFALFFVVGETVGIITGKGTLSSIIWALGGTTKGTVPNLWTWIRRIVLIGFLMWFNIHILSGGEIV